MFKSVFIKAGITVNIHSENNFSIKGHPGEFMQVILIILSNAKDAMIERGIRDGVIECYFETSGGTGFLKIRDNAGGIPQELLPDKIFEPYFTTKGEGGTGIGLQIARNIVEKHMRGSLTAANTENGAEFTLALPIEKFHKEADA